MPLNSERNLERALRGKRQGGHIEGWKFFEVEGSELGIVSGNIYGDEKYREGEWLTTTMVLKYHEEEKVIETLNTYYTLGDERPDIQLTEEEKKELSDTLDKLSGFF